MHFLFIHLVLAVLLKICESFQFEANCRKMLDLAKTNKISLRAQTKTHKTVEGGVLQVLSYKQALTTYKQQMLLLSITAL